MKAGITTIILTKNEEKNIRFAIESARQISERILVVDSGSEDMTAEIARDLGAEVVFHEWQGHAKQFNWALDHCNIDTLWVFRLDADERIPSGLAKEIKHRIRNTSADGFELRWRIYFMNKWIRHGGSHSHYFLRLFRFSKGRVEDSPIDERIIVVGSVERLKEDLVHYDYKSFDMWLSKHIWYSNLELDMFENQNKQNINRENQTEKHRSYYRLPIFVRAYLYYLYRYYLQLGFLDGKPGKIFCFLQAYWYRFLVDAKIYERGLKK